MEQEQPTVNGKQPKPKRVDYVTYSHANIVFGFVITIGLWLLVGALVGTVYGGMKIIDIIMGAIIFLLFSFFIYFPVGFILGWIFSEIVRAMKLKRNHAGIITSIILGGLIYGSPSIIFWGNFVLCISGAIAAGILAFLLSDDVPTDEDLIEKLY